MPYIKDKQGKDAFYVSDQQIKLYDRIKQKITHEDKDVIGVYCGETGSGKSLAAIRGAYMVDPTIDISRICFDKFEFIKAIVEAKRHTAIVGDEAISLFFSREIMTKENRILSRLMEQIRQKNLFIALCIPNILNMDTMIVEKAKFYVHVWESRDNNRTIKGNQAIYIDSKKNKNKTKFINYIRFKRKYPDKFIKKVKWNIRVKGSAVDSNPWYPVDEEDYRRKKDSILKDYKNIFNKITLSETEKKIRDQRDLMIYKLWESKGKPPINVFALEINVPGRTIRDGFDRIGADFRKNGGTGGV